jgi:hypothetical protein
MISSLLHNNKYQKELGNLIHKETEGNPFFIEEMLRSMEEGEVISLDEDRGKWALTKRIPEISVPDTIKDVVLARTDRLDKQMRRVLESASVFGVEFEYDILASVTDVDENQLVTYLDDLIHIKLVTELPCGLGEPVCYRFAHTKICEVLYDGLNQSRKRVLHRMIATSFEEKYKGDLDSITYELAQHYFQGNDYRHALQYSMNAGEKALQAFAPEKAKMYYTRALQSIELMEARPSETVSNKLQQAEIYLRLSDIAIIIGEWDEALKYAHELLKFSQDLDDNWKQVDAHNNIGTIHSYRSAWAEANDHFNKGLELAKKSNYDDGQLDARFGLGSIHERRGEYTEAMELQHTGVNTRYHWNILANVSSCFRRPMTSPNLQKHIRVSELLISSLVRSIRL